MSFDSIFNQTLVTDAISQLISGVIVPTFEIFLGAILMIVIVVVFVAFLRVFVRW